ncbi:hypothetical protein ElyMa_006265600 [Elysia marginata]|uniref:Uncharacterized protein n=1 Tax=Elysia marginata TaxID=1093978 RepID=A0AAV4HBI7_9GAST|nr:hypothetical protein ElyMa_006265600 [Elysia marginata]
MEGQFSTLRASLSCLIIKVRPLQAATNHQTQSMADQVLSETALETIESVLPQCDVRSIAYTTPSHIILTLGRPDLALNP